MKFNKRHAGQLREFLSAADANGCVPVTDWVSGKGRFTKPRALPPFVTRHERREYRQDQLPPHDSTERVAMRFFEANPRRRAVLVIDADACLEFLLESARGHEF